MFDFRPTTGPALMQPGMRGTTMGAPGPQQVAGNTIPTPWAHNSPAQAPLTLGAPQYNLGAGQSGVLAQQQALAAQLRQQGTAEIARRAAQQQAETQAAQQQAAAQAAQQQQQYAAGISYSNGEPIRQPYGID